LTASAIVTFVGYTSRHAFTARTSLTFTAQIAIIRYSVTIVIQAVAHFRLRSLEWIAFLGHTINASLNRMLACPITTGYRSKILICFTIAIVIDAVTHIFRRSIHGIAFLFFSIFTEFDGLRAGAQTAAQRPKFLVRFPITIIIRSIAFLKLGTVESITLLDDAGDTQRHLMIALSLSTPYIAQLLIGITVAIIILTVTKFRDSPLHGIAGLRLTAHTILNRVGAQTETARCASQTIIGLPVAIVVVCIAYFRRSPFHGFAGLPDSADTGRRHVVADSQAAADISKSVIGSAVTVIVEIVACLRLLPKIGLTDLRQSIEAVIHRMSADAQPACGLTEAFICFAVTIVIFTVASFCLGSLIRIALLRQPVHTHVNGMKAFPLPA
jgi:hypothetical protein